MKKIVISSFLTLCIFTVLSAQEIPEIEKLVAKKVETVPLSKFVAGRAPANQISLQVIDARFDTSKLGYYEDKGIRRAKAGSRIFFPFQLEGGTAGGWGSLLSQRLGENHFQPVKLLAVIRNFWMTEYVDESTEKGRPDVISASRNRIVFGADYFMEHDGMYYPFARIDTAFVGTAVDMDHEDHLVGQLLDLHVKAFQKTDPEKVKKRTGYTIELIREKNVLPIHAIFSPDTQLQKGIYRSFEEFLANRPSEKLAEETDSTENKKKKKTKEPVPPGFFTDSRKEGQLSVLEMWGYSDGLHIYIQLHGNFYPAARIGNAFEIYASNQKPYTPGTAVGTAVGQALFGLAFDTVVDIKGKKWNPFPMQIDMRKGTVY